MSWMFSSTQTQASQTEPQPQTQPDRAIGSYQYGSEFFPRYNSDLLHEIRLQQSDNIDLEFGNSNLAIYHPQHELHENLRTDELTMSPVDRVGHTETNGIPSERVTGLLDDHRQGIIQTTHSEHNYCTTQDTFVNFLSYVNEEFATNVNGVSHRNEIRPDEMFNNQNSMITHSQAPSTSNLLYVNEVIRNRQEEGVWTSPSQDYTLYYMDDAEMQENERTAVLNLSSSSILSSTVHSEDNNDDINQAVHIDYADIGNENNDVFRTPSPPIPIHSSSTVATSTPSCSLTPTATPTIRRHSLETAIGTPRHIRRAQPPPMDELSLSSASEAEYVQFANTRTTNTTTTTSAAKRKNKVYSHNLNNGISNTNSNSDSNNNNRSDNDANSTLFNVSD